MNFVDFDHRFAGCVKHAARLLLDLVRSGLYCIPALRDCYRLVAISITAYSSPRERPLKSYSSIDYAHAEGIYSLAGAIIFAVVYAPLFILFVLKSVRIPTYVHFVLSFFCLIRMVAFTLRAVLAGSTSAAHNENLLIAEQVVYSVSFFGVLYSAYTLVLDRESLVDMSFIETYAPGPVQLLFRIMRMRMLIRMALMVAVILGIVGAVDYESATTIAKLNSGLHLRSASVYIFLAVSCLLAINTVVLSAATVRSFSQKPPAYEAQEHPKLGTTYGVFILLAISALIVTREAFYTATESNLSKQNNEKLWYPLSALTEFIAVTLFAIPGLVPSRRELPAEERELKLLS